MRLWILVAALGCGGAPEVIDHLDAEHVAVALLSSDCSAVLVRERSLLTAAHCAGDAHEVTFWSGSGRRVFRIDGCRVHPQAMIESGDCSQIDPSATVRDHDLAILHLVEAVPREVARPSPVLLEAPDAGFWDRQRLLLVGWHRHPAAVGQARRYAGENRVQALEGSMLHTLPLSPGGFQTEIGASGGPALLTMRGAEEWVVGVLFGGTYPGSPDSLYAATFEPENARFITHVLDESEPVEEADLAQEASSLP